MAIAVKPSTVLQNPYYQVQVKRTENPLHIVLKLRKVLHGVTPENTVVFSDLVNTLMAQSVQGGFPIQQQEMIRKILDRNCQLIVVTGDSIQTVEKTFLMPLAYQGRTPFYVVTGAGHQVWQIQNGQVTELFRGPVFSVEDRKKMLDEVTKALSEFAGTPIDFTKEEAKLLSEEGDRFNLNSKLSNHEHLFLEVRPNTVALVCPPSCFKTFSETSKQKLQLLYDQLQSNSVIKEILQRNKMFFVRMDRTINIISAVKSMGVQRFLDLKKGQTSPLENRHVVVLGDSQNDKELFGFPYHHYTNGKIVKVFVGENDSLFKEIAQNTPKGDAFYLKGAFINGSQHVFSVMTSS